MSEYFPVQIQQTDSGTLRIEWNDGANRELPLRFLREACQCATCSEKNMGSSESENQPAGSLPILSVEQTQPLRIVSMRPVGNYGYNIQFSDGHNTGIYTIDFLRALMEAAPEA